MKTLKERLVLENMSKQLLTEALLKLGELNEKILKCSSWEEVRGIADEWSWIILHLGCCGEQIIQTSHFKEAKKHLEEICKKFKEK